MIHHPLEAKVDCQSAISNGARQIAGSRLANGPLQNFFASQWGAMSAKPESWDGFKLPLQDPTPQHRDSTGNGSDGPEFADPYK
jgi:hypothetical protein